MQAIRTVYHGPTDYRGSRIIATSSDGRRLTLPYDHALDIDELHTLAATKLIEKNGWGHVGDFVSGCFKNDYYHVFTG